MAVIPFPATRAGVVHAARARRGKAGRRGRLFAVVPCKGGSGATFVATNLGWLLGQRFSVLLVDLNLQFGDALSFVHPGWPARTIADVAALAPLDPALLAASSVRVARGFSVLAAPLDPGQALDVTAADVDAILSVALRQYDFVLADMGRALDPVGLCALDLAESILPVLQPTVPGVRDGVRLRQAFLSLGYAPQRMRFVVNACGKASDTSLDQVRHALGSTAVVALGEAQYEVACALRCAEPFVQLWRAHPVTTQIARLARDLAAPGDGSDGRHGAEVLRFAGATRERTA